MVADVPAPAVAKRPWRVENAASLAGVLLAEPRSGFFRFCPAKVRRRRTGAVGRRRRRPG